MAHRSRRARSFAASVAGLVAGGSLLVVAPPASGATTTFGTAAPTYLGDASYEAQGGAIAVPEEGDQGIAGPYPSQLVVPAHQATILDLDVRLNGFTSTAPTDLDVLLVGPGGQQALIMSDAGNGDDVAGIQITLNDEAATPMTSAQLGTAGYQPTNLFPPTDVLPEPAPAPNGNSSLSVFDGTSPSGVWKLYVFDDTALDIHAISSWTLDFSLATSPYPSTVAVSGMPTITDVNVRLHNVDSASTNDVHLRLVGPTGQQAYLMGSAGSSSPGTDLELTVDDEAPLAFPDSGLLTSGSYRPFRYSVATFPPPAPAGTPGSALGVFDGTNPNGEWRLFAVDVGGENLTSIGGWSLEFSWVDAQAPKGSVSINQGASSTASPQVTLHLAATDPAPATGVTQMRFSNDGTTFSAYQPYATTLAWTLSGGNGTKTVYAQFRDGDGNQSAVANDAIILDQDTRGPRARKLSPRRSASGVKVTVKVAVRANEPLDQQSVSKRSAFLKEKGTTGKVRAKVRYRAATRTIVIRPMSPLDARTTYRVTVKGVRDLAGNRWDEKPKKAGSQPLRFSFTTAVGGGRVHWTGDRFAPSVRS